MPRLSADTLLQRAIWPAVQDRRSLADAYNREGPDAAEALADAKRVQALSGKPFRKLSDEERETARLAFLYAEQWETSLADAQGRDNPKEREACELSARLFREFRLKEWGKTVLEDALETAPSVDILDLIHQKSRPRSSRP
jgi:hypothetical protein